MENLSRLENGASQLGLNLSEAQIDQSLSYIALIQKWNKAYNLVGTSDTQELVCKHLLDSFSIVPHIKHSPVLDVGSGAGLPGIPLAISLPDISFTLLDSNGKKARFMRQACIELGLNNVEIVQSRIENYVTNTVYTTVLSRAFAPLGSAIVQLSNVCAPEGQVLIMLGAKPTQLPKIDGIKEMLIHTLAVPGLSSDRHLLVINK